MQQAIYNRSNLIRLSQTNPAASSRTTSPAAGVLRWVARKWDLVGVVALMGSSAAYGAFALAHVGL